MNESEREELELLKRRLWEMRDQLAAFGRDMEMLERRLAQPPPTETKSVPPLPQVPKETPKPIILPPIPPIIQRPVIPQPPPPPATPPPIPTPQKAPAPPTPPARPVEPVLAYQQKQSSAEPQTGAPTSEPATEAARDKGSSFEMRLGTFWLVRIGIVMLLTGLVFFGTYAYQNFIPRLGPVGKVSLLYLASGLLLGTGAWLQRKQESMKNYAQVLVAGGLAAVYFTTYAAHHIANLEVIRDPVIDGALLLGWAGFIIWLADRTKSEVLALFAVLLAYYTSVITHAGLFTLYSNLVLTAAAVFFLVRNRWATLSFASLVATYASYGFWRFYQEGHWQWASPTTGLWAGNYFLMSYWVIFTVALFLSKHEQFAGGRRATFLSLNNAAFFSAFILTMYQVHQGGFWKFSLTYGSVLLGLFGLAWWRRPEDKIFRNAYLTQGLLLVTLGFITHFTGLRLSLVLAFESVTLLVLGQQVQNRVMRIGSYITAALAVGWGLVNTQPLDRDGLISGIVVGAMLLFNAFRLRKETDYDRSVQHLPTLFFTALALLMWAGVSWQNATPHWRGLVFAVESWLLLLAARPLGNRALNFGAMIFASFAVGLQINAGIEQFNSVGFALHVGWQQSALVGAVMLVNALLQRRLEPPKTEQTIQPPVVLFSCLSLATWLVVTCVFANPDYLAPLLALEALLFTVAYYPLRLMEVTVLGQLFLIAAQLSWIVEAAAQHPARPWWNPATVIVVTLAISQWWQRQSVLKLEKNFVQVVQGLYALAVVGLLFFWLQPQFAGTNWLALAGLLALLLTAYGVVTRSWLLAAAGQIFVVISGWEFFHQLAEGKPEWWVPLVPVVVMCVLAFSTVEWFKRRPEANPELASSLLNVSLVYRVVALVMSLWWVHKYITPSEQCWVFALIGLLLFGLAGWRRSLELLIFSGIFSAMAVIQFWLPPDSAPAVYWPNLLVLFLLLVQQRLAKRWPDHYQMPPTAHAGIIVAGSLSLWHYLSLWVAPAELTAVWSGLALVLFVVGVMLRERVYRWLGLAILACALGHVIFIDIWKLEIIYRILSFMAMGIVLLVLGFLYNKYQERIKEWL
ncbi:MAG: Membrane protein-like protein [Pedosphaera sp.]|nr:Membrane protein-like protein [Pedosphaera sp.]